jgi:hypothetical protein
MDVRRDADLWIETPAGFIRLRRVSGTKFEFELPEGMQVHRTEERALSRARFVRRDEQGRLVPTYAVLQPQVVEGELVGVKVPPVVRLAKVQA